MQSFKEHLTESMRKPADADHLRMSGDFNEYTFAIGKNAYTLTMVEGDRDHWHISFAYRKTFDHVPTESELQNVDDLHQVNLSTNFGESSQVLSAVVNGIYQIIKRRNFDSGIFLRWMAEPKRYQVYDRMAAILIKRTNGAFVRWQGNSLELVVPASQLKLN
ncbi:hypothetical protein EVB91_254 [Rhizobium phage RHph_I1_18]|nr:hypothetical protein EVB91_254 [Rhizobium phage RHph_I1_18]